MRWLLVLLLCGAAMFACASDLSECLGFAKTDRVMIVNADDVGMHPDLDKAAFELIDKGLVQEISIMPPTPNFANAAEMAKARHMSIGVHLTLTNE